MVKSNPNMLMFREAIDNSFSNRHRIEWVNDQVAYIEQQGRKTHLRAMSRSEREDMPLDELRDMVLEQMYLNTKANIYTAFIFLRCETDYDTKKNLHIGFLRQKGIKGMPRSKARGLDHRNVKSLTKLELVVSDMYNNGVDSFGFSSRLVYFNPKTDGFESVMFQSVPDAIYKQCMSDRFCMKDSIIIEESFDYSNCKKRGCTKYAWDRDAKVIRLNQMQNPIRIVPDEIASERTNYNLAKILGK